MATLSDRHQAFIVQRLACYATVREVQEAVKEEFGVAATLHQVSYYNPTTTTGGEPAEKWVDLFEETRESYLESTQGLAIAQRVWRLEQLEDGFRRLRKSDPAAAARLLEQAAKETGGKYTNKHEWTGENGRPIQIESKNVNVDVADLEDTDDPEELMRRFNDTFGGEAA